MPLARPLTMEAPVLKPPTTTPFPLEHLAAFAIVFLLGLAYNQRGKSPFG